VEALRQLSEALERLPGLGRRSAERIAAHLARHAEDAAAVESALAAARGTLTTCRLCGTVTRKEENPCRLCTDEHRDGRLLCVVGDSGDIALLERSGEYRGRYFALGGTMSPGHGRGVESLRLGELMARTEEGVDEVLLALDSDVESEATASYLRHELQRRRPGIRVTRLALGLPAGGAIAYADPVTLGRAVRGRTEA
jgi:recombination protein RecR